MKKALYVVFGGIAFFSGMLASHFQILDAKEFTCSKENAKQVISELTSPFTQDKNGKVEVFEVREITLNEFELCEAVVSFPHPGGLKDLSVMKNIIYFGKDFVILGDIRVKEGDRVKSITSERFNEVNREAFEKLQQAMKEEEKKFYEKIKELVEKDYTLLRKKADVVLGLGKKEPRYEIVVMGDPYCPHCKRLIEYLEDKVKTKNIRVYVIFTPVLSEQGKNVVAGILCGIKTSNERIKAFKEVRLNQNTALKPCKAGLDKVEENIEIFSKYGFTGVPSGFIFEVGRGKSRFVDIIRGAEIGKIEKLLSN